jgi:hypothetical protein
MATVVNFYGKNYIEPGSYATTVYNPTSISNVAQFGNVMIIDTGLSRNGIYEFAGGSGVHGELNKGLKSVYEFQNYEDFLAFMGGGLVGDIAKNIFTPAPGVAGAPKLYYVRAATTTCANMVITFSPGNALNLKCKNEGVVGNGVVVNNVLKAGYAAKVIAGDDAGTFKLQVYRGTFMGVDEAGESFGAYSETDSVPNLIIESPDLTTLLDLYTWAINDKYMLANFVISKTGADATLLSSVNQTLAVGGTTSFLSNTEYSDILEAISELDVTFFLCDNLNASQGQGVSAMTNAKLFTFLKQSAKFTEFMVVPGGENDTDLFGDSNSSESIAKFYNSGQAIVVHGAPVVMRKDQNGTKNLHSIYLAASIVGLNAGLSPQTPLTFKRVGYQNFVYDLKKKERENALQAGIMHVRNVSGYWCVNQGVTTLLNNKKTIADDGQSFELSIELIKSQLNKELILEGQARFTGQTAAQASPESVNNFTQTKLASFVAYPGNDKLLISWKNVKVVAKNSDFYITYDFVPNVPVNKTFFIGNVLDFSVKN